MMKFASFEAVVENIYKYAIPAPKSECSKSLQLGVSFAGGYIAGVFCAIVSHPADNLVSFLNNAKGATVGDVSFCLFIVFCLYNLGFSCAPCSGCEEDWFGGPLYTWASIAYCDDWYPHRRPVGYL
jgi:hypothetical protein